jgi:hypothetical protein
MTAKPIFEIVSYYVFLESLTSSAVSKNRKEKYTIAKGAIKVTGIISNDDL